MSEADPLLVSQVLAWDLGPANDLAATLSRVAAEIESEVEAVARSVRDSYSYFVGTTGDALRQRCEDDRRDTLTTVDLYESMSDTSSPLWRFSRR